MSHKHLPRTNGVGRRQVLIPGKNKAVRHPWANKFALILAAKR